MINRIIIHWTAGTNIPNGIDRLHYHFLIDSSGKIYNGNFKPEDNINCKDDKYAEHTGGGNTGSIGIAFCGMLGYVSPINNGIYPLKANQLESGYKLIAQLCKKYKIPVTPQSVMTHYEFGKAHPASSSYGKIDINYLPTEPKLKADEIGDFIRKKISWYLSKI